MIRDGERLRDIAEHVGIPMSFKRFRPGVCSKTLEKIKPLLYAHPEIVSHHCPKALSKQRAWIMTIHKALESVGEDFAIWAAQHWSEIPGKYNHIPEAISDIGDWAKAGMIERVWGIDMSFVQQAMLASNHPELAECVIDWRNQLPEPVPAGRCFEPDMSAETVLRLSSEWHERASEAQTVGVEFPEPWYEGDIVDDYRIEPVNTANQLSLYAKQLRNCAGAYAHDIAEGSIFMYVVFALSAEGPSSRPEAMFDLENNNGYRSLGQLKGPCNQAAPKELATAVKLWLRGQKETLDVAA